MRKWVALWLIPICLFVFSSCAVSGEIQKQNIKVAVIVKSATSFFWETVFRGVETARNEYANMDIEIVYKAPKSEDDYVEQNELIKEAINEDKVQAIVLSASHYKESSAYIEAAVQQGIRVVTIDSGIWSEEQNFPYIGTDNQAAGMQAGEAIASLIGTTGKIGVISFEETTGNGQQRVKGLQNYIEENTEIVIEFIEYALSNEKASYNKTKLMLEKYTDLDGLVTFNEITTLGVGDAIRDMGYEDKIAVVGFDNNIRSISLLETGYMDALIVQNPFAMGYLGLQSVVDNIVSGKQMEDIDTPTEMITKENMYDIDKQKILFPLVG